jgi:hypothetical protein
MAGSQTWRTYIDDYGNRYSYECSKHYQNGGAYNTVFGVAQFSEVRAGDYPPIPPELEPRYAIIHLAYVNDGGRGFVSKPLYKAKKARVIVGNPLAMRNMVNPDFAYVFFTSPGEIAASAWNPTYVSGERRTLKTNIGILY